MNKTTRTQKRNEKITENRYVGLNEGQDMWEVDFSAGTAKYIGQRVTLDDLEVNNRKHLYEEYGDSIENWLKEHGYITFPYGEGDDSAVDFITSKKLNEPKRHHTKPHGKTCPCADCGESRAVEAFEYSISQEYIESQRDIKEQAF